MREKIQRALWPALFLAGVVLLLCVTSFLAVPRNNRLENGMEELRANGILAEPEGTIDLVIIGDSETACGLAPAVLWEEYGIPSYVIGTGAQKTTEAEFYLRRAIQAQHPKAVVLQVNPMFEEYNLADLVKSRLDWYLPVFRYHDRWKKFSAEEIWQEPAYTYNTDRKGADPSMTVRGTELPDFMEYSDAAADVPVMNRRILSDILRICEKNDVRLILAATPSSDYWYYEWHNAAEAMAEEYSLPFIDLSILPEEYAIDWSRDTRDAGLHMNNYGAWKLTRYLGDRISSMDLLPDRREDPAWEHWKQMEEIYEADFFFAK